MRVCENAWPPEVVRRVGGVLSERGVSYTSKTFREKDGTISRVLAEVALFGRREKVAFDAIDLTRSLVTALGIPEHDQYIFQLHDGYLDSQVWRRLNEDTLRRPDAMERARELRALR